MHINNQFEGNELLRMRNLHCARNIKRGNVSTKALHQSVIFMFCRQSSDLILTPSCLELLNDIYRERDQYDMKIH